MSQETEGIRTLDVRGEICPYPVMKTREAMDELEPGEQLEVWLDYPLALEEIPNWAEDAGHEVLAVEETGNSEWRIRLRKGP
ncbi:MAG: sulfurtransferase TusA family protein [Salinibacter sp.]